MMAVQHFNKYVQAAWKATPKITISTYRYVLEKIC